MEILKKTVKLPVVNFAGEKVEDITLQGEVFAINPNEYVVRDSVRVYLANMRQATAKTKTRAEVSGSGKKPFRQKGTGRARAGDIRSPLWRHGGVAFGPTGEQNYKLAMNRKEHALALKSVLSDKVASKGVIVLEDKKFESSKTKDFVAVLKALKIEGKVLIVIDSAEYYDLFLAAKNIPGVIVESAVELCVYDVINASTLLITKKAAEQVEEVLLNA